MKMFSKQSDSLALSQWMRHCK